MQRLNNFDNYLFHASGVGNLFVEPRSKSETLSETAKSWLDTIFIKEFWGRENRIETKYFEKGTKNEKQAIDLLTTEIFAERGYFLVKNSIRYQNEFLTGEPDVIEDSFIVENKCPFGLFQFDKAELTNIYNIQIQSYMLLCGKPLAYLCYVLTNTPQHIVDNEIKRLDYLDLMLSEYQDRKEQIILNHNFDDIPAKLRIKIFDIPYDNTFAERLENKVLAARKYLNDKVKTYTL
jgi:hypothetical protein